MDIKGLIKMAKKAKQQLTTDVAKAVWEEYANIILENWVTELSVAVASGEMDAVREVGIKMATFKFDFNRGNK